MSGPKHINKFVKEVLGDLEKREEQMSKAKHTPGPWHLNKYRDGSLDISAKNGAVALIKVHWGIGPDYERPPKQALGRLKSEALANARLIAAAPEMLEALEAALHGLNCNYQADDEDTGLPEITRQVKAAINKARGE